MYKFGEKSEEKLLTCHDDLIKIMRLAIKRSRVDFGISEGHRSIERQNELFKKGKSKVDGINEKGKHNYNPSLAVDIYAYHPIYEIRKQLAYDRVTLSYIAGVIESCAFELFEEDLIDHLVRHGANWDMDGIIALDQSFDDFPHFELHKPNS